MSLLMVFFVLMLSFSEMDVAKFKELAGSVQNAFGVQTEIDVKGTPKGTSLIAREFSPGRPEPTALNTIRQFTINSNLNTLDIEVNERAKELEEQERRAQEEAQRLREALLEEIEEGKLLIRREGTEVILQILEKDSFASGSAAVDPGFMPTLGRIGRLMTTVSGAIAVSGHTDDVPISNSQYRSNWDLSAARAASVVFQLLDAGLSPERIMVSGHADTQPRAPNDTPANRSLNRRVDVTLFTGKERHGSWVGVEPASSAAAATATPAAETSIPMEPPEQP
jgi:chemotaxis protein MotB